MSQDLVSFVLRFVRESGEDQQARWRGLVKHVQSNTESNFSQFAEALAFMQSHVNEATQAGFDRASRAAGEMNKADPLSETIKLWGSFMPPFARAIMETAGESVKDQFGDLGDFNMSSKDNPFQMNLELWQQFSDSYTKNMFSMFERNLEQSKAFQEQLQAAVNQAVETQFKMVRNGLESMEKQLEELSNRMAELTPAQSNGKKAK